MKKETEREIEKKKLKEKLKKRNWKKGTEKKELEKRNWKKGTEKEIGKGKWIKVFFDRSRRKKQERYLYCFGWYR